MKWWAKGFTLIELMIAIAIVAILAAIALPAYLDYTTRAKISEGLVVLDGLRLSLEEVYYVDGLLSDQNASFATIIGAQTQFGRYISTVIYKSTTPASAAAGAFEQGGNSIDESTLIGIIYNNNIAPAANRSLCMAPTFQPHSDFSGNVFANLTGEPRSDVSRKLTWICRSSSAANRAIQQKYLPPNCRGIAGRSSLCF